MARQPRITYPGAYCHVMARGNRRQVIVRDDEERPEGASAEYLPALMDYVHLNPARAKLVDPEQGLSLLDFPWKDFHISA